MDIPGRLLGPLYGPFCWEYQKYLGTYRNRNENRRKIVIHGQTGECGLIVWCIDIQV